MEYNLMSGSSKVLVGNWQENRALEKVGAPARVAGRDAKSIDTFERVMPNCRSGSARGWASETAHMCESGNLSVALAHGAAHPEHGPRAMLRKQLMRKEAEAFATALLTPEPVTTPYETSAATQFQPYASSEYKVETVPDAPITIYSQRLVEGIVPMSAVYNSASPFARSTAFSAPIDAPFHTHTHAEATEGLRAQVPPGATLSRDAVLAAADQVVPLARSMRLGVSDPGAMDASSACVSVSAHTLTRRVLLRFAHAKGAFAGLTAFLDALRDAAPGVSEDGITFPPDAVRRVMHTHAHTLGHKDMECFLALCDPGDTQFSVDLMLAHVRASLQSTRRGIASEVIAACRGADSARVTDVATRVRVPSLDKVRFPGSDVTEATLVEALLRLLMHCGVDDAVTSEHIQTYIAAISPAVEDDAAFRAVIAGLFSLPK